MDHDDVIVPDRDNVIAMYHDHNIMMGPGTETVTDHDHGISFTLPVGSSFRSSFCFSYEAREFS